MGIDERDERDGRDERHWREETDETDKRNESDERDVRDEREERDGRNERDERDGFVFVRVCTDTCQHSQAFDGIHIHSHVLGALPVHMSERFLRRLWDTVNLQCLSTSRDIYR